MILQTDRRLREKIREEGCYFMCLLWYGNKYGHYELDPDKINELYKLFVDNDWMTEKCKILHPNNIINLLGVRALYTDRHEKPSRMCKDGEFEILCFGLGDMLHFTAGDGKGHITYDPMGESKTARDGLLMSKRIFMR